jgi:predicted MFS family arabinose efflux permease
MQQEQTLRSSRGALGRYMVAAVLARGADAGAGLGLILVALDPAAHLSAPGRTSGLLVAALTAPHLLGPVVARRLDAVADARPALGAAFVTYAGGLAAATWSLGNLPLPVTLLLVAVAGSAGPLLTGGLSSQLGGIVGGGERTQRRADGWDAISYGVAGTAGPAAVALLATLVDPRPALFAVCALVLLAAAVTLGLPAPERDAAPVEAPARLRNALTLVARSGPLRRVTYATMATSFAGAALGLLAVSLGAQLAHRHGAGALLATVFGLGNLLGSLVVTGYPLRGEPERLTTWTVAAIAVAYALCAVVPTYPLAVVAFALAGAANAPFVTATLAARAVYAPEGSRAQVFVSVAGLKVAAGAVGSALAGSLLASIGARTLLGAGAAVAALAAAATVLERARAGIPARERS